MVHFLRTLLFSVTIVSSLHCMENTKMEVTNYDLVTRQKSKKWTSIVHKKSKKSLSLPTVNTQQEVKEHPLITATRYKDHDAIKFHLSNRYFNPNVQDLQLNTPLHHAAKNRDRVAIELFIKDPRINASIKNIDNAQARDLVFPANADRNTVNEQLVELKRIIFARITLGIIVEQESTRLNLKAIYDHHLLTPDIINRIIDRVTNKIRAIEQQQQKPLLENKDEIKEEKEKEDEENIYDDRKLPTSALLPSYATRDFIQDMLYFPLTPKET